MILNEETNLSFAQVYKMLDLLYKPFEEWDAYNKEIIDKEGNILKSGQLNWIELFVRNLKKLLLKHVIYKGVKGQNVLDKKLYKYTKFLKESYNLYELNNKELNENEIMKISVSKQFEHLFKKCVIKE